VPNTECPLPADSQVYTVPGTNLTFLRSCATDYPGNDMAKYPVASMSDCLLLCAQLNLYPSSSLGRCRGVSWVYGEGPQGLNNSFCFPKNVMSSSMGKGSVESAVLLT
jgi:hypothetical protein